MIQNLKFCPFCEGNIEAKRIKSEEEWLLGNVLVSVDMFFFRCPLCGEEFFVMDNEYDPFEYAYKEYKRISGKKWTGGESSVISRKETIT